MLFPFLPDLRHYQKTALRFDLQAGLTVAIFAVPQAMAYAMLAGLPPVYGLYSAMVMAVVAALWGSSDFINTGPTNSAALLTATALLPFAGHHDFLRILFLLTLLIGIIRLLLGLFRCGRFLDFVSESAFVGFTVGAGLLIALGQIHHLLGVEASSAASFLLRLFDVLGRVAETNPYPLAIGLGCFICMQALRKYAARIPVAIIAIVAASFAASLLNPELRHIPLVLNIAPVNAGLPSPSVPLFDLTIAIQLLPAALAIAVIGLVEAVSIGQTLALRHDKTLQFNQEFIGQGLSHIVGAFFQSIPGSGSFGRSALLEASGARTRFSNIFFSLFIAGALLTIPLLLNRIPIAALAGLLLYVGCGLIDTHKIRRILNTSRIDTIVMLATFFVTVFIKIEYGIFVGIILSAVLYLNQARTLHAALLIPDRNGNLIERDIQACGRQDTDILAVVNFNGDLFYGVAHTLRRFLNDIRHEHHPDILLIRMRRAYSIDYSCWSAIFDFAKAYAEQGGTLYLCGVRPDAMEIIRSADMEGILHHHQIYPATDVPFQGFESAVAHIARDHPEFTSHLPNWKAYLAQATSHQIEQIAE